MNENQAQLNQLIHKLEILQKRQDAFSKEIIDLSNEINRLKSKSLEDRSEKELAKSEVTPEPFAESKKELSYNEDQKVQQSATKSSQKTEAQKATPRIKKDIEKFIGENLINKIGIAILIIGVGIGAKYSIEHDLISPLTRIILGYFTGIGLLLFGIKLKKNLESFSAVLVSGAIAIMYFITYAAYGFYDLFPQMMTFALMVFFTIFSVITAIHYNRQIIAHIGLVGAYAVPFLLSEGSGKIEMLFSYMLIINIGILIIAFKKYWKALYYSSFALTWLILITWYLTAYQSHQHFGMTIAFLLAFFVLFYLMFLVYKLRKSERFAFSDIFLLVFNSFIFYGVGFNLLSKHPGGSELLGVFTLCNAVLHFIISVIIYKKKQADKNFFYLVSGLVLIFLTIAVPIQLDGNWVTMLWAGEAALLFWIGRTKNVQVYEVLAYPLMLLAFFSINHDWSTVYRVYSVENFKPSITPLFNINFLTSVLVILSFGFMTYLNRNKRFPSALNQHTGLLNIVAILIPSLFVFTLYQALRMEIACYWDQRYAASMINIKDENAQIIDYFSNYDLKQFKSIWTINYTLLFTSLLSFLNHKKIKSKLLGTANTIFIVLTIIVFLSSGLYDLSRLRNTFTSQHLAEYYSINAFYIGIRYVSFAFVAFALFACYTYVRQEPKQKYLRTAFEFLLHTTTIWIASSELINWMDLAQTNNKFGLSILWGTYSLFLIVLGIWKKKKHLRIGAIILLGITLVKLFLYDISHLNTIAKTTVFVSLGVLLLVISYLYNKYKHIISDENDQ
ncbi:DUF2339 domain-containing protein [Brumimicrobium sp.]|uniref:DUF2339 domain-containing protein n=1 Tax=Brumimicrobium sp. TaxID=2029867 RepID=UPI002612C0DE|nr:DUF2339 domain-containing protein [uncultured Brumimicrobium sp.]